ncbi:MAG: hypothetical protein IJW46_05980 [Clostridia bacterium]|nr:hypothetical protein [Clostridia bacterium]
MKLGKTLNRLIDSVTTEVAVAGLACAPFTGGSSFILAGMAIGTAKMIAYAVENIEDTLTGTNK